MRDVPLPATLSASQLLRLAADPDGFAQELARPMPRPPQPAARRGTRFHAWVESRFEELPLPMLGPDELPGGDEDDPEIADERDLAALKEAFERTPYARRTPYRVEAPFQITLAGRVIRGRIDAVYRDRPPGRRTRTKSSTGRPAAPLTPTRSSSPSTVSPGPSSTDLPLERGHRRVPLRTQRGDSLRPRPLCPGRARGAPAAATTPASARDRPPGRRAPGPAPGPIGSSA